MVDLNNFHRIVLDPGNMVVCDLCNADYTNSDRSGGIMFSGKAVCPDCTPRFEKTIKKYKEEQYITGRCPENVSFADWIRDSIRQ